MSGPRLLVISGPIASGKSTAATLLVRGARAVGRSAAAIDLDALYVMLEDTAPMAEPRLWRMARRAAAALVDQFVRDGVGLIVVEGTFWTMSERAELAACLSTPVQPVYATLRVSVEEAERRVAGDPSRRFSKIPEVLRGSHANFAAIAPIVSDVAIDSTMMSIDEVVSVLNAALDSRAERSALTGAEIAPLVGDIDCLQIPVPDIEAGLAFYRDALGHVMLWRTETAAGLQMSGSRAELVLQTERPELEANLSVGSADTAAQRFVGAGGAVVAPPFDIAIGRCTVVQDPWGNRLVLLDHRTGRLLTNAEGFVVGVSAVE